MSQGIYLSDVPVRRPALAGNSLARKMQRACRLSLPEPDLALNLDVADFINAKQGAAPREAAIGIVRLINSRDTHTAVFALALLDVLVKNCGYPFHLQISRKEFLNELVKKFPERPPLRFTKVQRLILTAIEEWYQTICKHTNYKEDMGYIRDMHRLLKYKGYIFPKIKEEDLAVLRPGDHLKTPSEIQKEQEIAQAAKLEELIRRGRPEDLKEANKLMKVMAGFKEDNAIKSKQLINDELVKLKRKADLFKDMLSASETPDFSNETLVELYSALKVSQPKFQKIIEEEHEDDVLVQDLLQFNDTVNQLVQKYNLLKTGEAGQAAQIQVSSISSPPAGSGGALANEINLIDFGDDEEQASSPQGQDSGNPVEDLLGDLNNLSFSQPSQGFGLGGSISLGASQPTAQVSSGSEFDLLGNLSNTPSPAATAQPPKNTQFSGDDFTEAFGSIEPENSVAHNRVEVSSSTSLKIEFDLSRKSESSINITSFFSNVGPSPISELTFMVAVPKSMTLNLKPQSGNFIPGYGADGVTQSGTIENAFSNNGKPLKVKWKASYVVNATPVEETAIFTFPQI
ncbi:ubiquitin-binding protein [Lachancea thermotolerans CBS 6340]|uniref:KLTH0F16456p n=1 Tax=Lachancea thermotolerans (strain ATCC 56472 / CBS 6340 / NRRL Y-8284) TaxID=559295 RepID=C5DJH4_LACTC|nr:KLTH0F16456p [Lachancea thermotolerans CBS 6340]CAR24463.1 KLTH0F16456p [Lachancea thermotolerans CBS 6340]